jgi:hypothetical protein
MRRKDFLYTAKYAQQHAFRKGLAVTCLDQVGDEVTFWYQNEKYCTSSDVMIEILKAEIGADFSFQSFRPSAEDVVEFEG